MTNCHQNRCPPHERHCQMLHWFHLYMDPHNATPRTTRWPQIINKTFWPFATCHAVNIYVNCYRGCQSMAISLIEEFTNMPTSLTPQDLHPWDCPVYVLDKRLQDGNHTSSKWESCAWLGIYDVGHSTIHSGNVILVYNPTTGHTTPQFHIVFDDYFQTVTANFSSLPHDSVDNLFEQLWTTSQWIYDSDIPPEYLFQETADLPDSDDNLVHHISDHQLATDVLDDTTLTVYIDGIPLPSSQNPNQSLKPNTNKSKFGPTNSIQRCNTSSRPTVNLWI